MVNQSAFFFAISAPLREINLKSDYNAKKSGRSHAEAQRSQSLFFCT